MPDPSHTPTIFAPQRRGTAASRLAMTLGLGLLLTGCGSDYPLGPEQEQAAQQTGSSLVGTLTGGGSSAQNSAMNAWSAGFATLNPRAQVQYASVGSGAGRAGLLAGATAFAGSDAYLKDSELARSRQVCGDGGAINVPVYISPISIAFNLPGITELNLDAATLADIFAGSITSWNDSAITELNPGISIPDIPMTTVARSDDSGTTENFTEYLHATAPSQWTHDPSGTWPSEAGSEQAQGNNGVITTVARTKGALTYADDSLVDATLGKVKLQVGDSFVAVSGEAAALAVAASQRVAGRGENDIALELDRNTTAAGAYPLVLVSYLVMCSGYSDPETLALVQAFAHYVTGAPGQLVAAESAKSAQLPPDLAADAKIAIDSITLRR